MDNSNSGVNTIILIVLLVVVLFGVYWLVRGGSAQEEPGGVNLELNLPQGEAGDGGNQNQ